MHLFQSLKSVSDRGSIDLFYCIYDDQGMGFYQIQIPVLRASQKIYLDCRHLQQHGLASALANCLPYIAFQNLNG